VTAGELAAVHPGLVAAARDMRVCVVCLDRQLSAAGGGTPGPEGVR
jgi:hypothetical protein